MTGAAKHITMGTGILVVCVLVLVFAFTPPSERGGEDVMLATQDTEQRRSPQTPSMQPSTPRSVDTRGGDRPARETLGPQDLQDERAQPEAPDRSEVEPTPVRPSGADRVLTWDDIDALPGGESLVARPTRSDDQPVHRETEAPVGAEDDDWAPDARAADEDTVSPDDTRVAAAPQGEQRHVVVEGETYQSISAQYYGTTRLWRRILEANDADERSLMPDMVLIIPAADEDRPQVASTRRDDQAGVDKGHAAAERRYTVQRGDSYYTIARDQLGDARRYRELEQLNGIDPYELRVGMVITLPATRAGGRQEGERRTAPTPPQAAEGQVVHVVERGDILGEISMRYYGTSRRWREIAEANNITDRDPLHVGQRLIIPGASLGADAAPSQSAAASAAPRGEGAGRWHTVERGDTLQEISRRYYGTTQRHNELAAANPELDARRLMVGTRVWVPGASSDAPSQPRQERQPSRDERQPASGGPAWD